MNSKLEVKRLLKEKKLIHLFTEENYRIATALTKVVEKNDKVLSGYFTIEGNREEYKVDLIIKNCK